MLQPGLLQGRDQTVTGGEVRNRRAMQGERSAQQRGRLFAPTIGEIAQPNRIQLKGHSVRRRPRWFAREPAIGSADG